MRTTRVEAIALLLLPPTVATLAGPPSTDLGSHSADPFRLLVSVVGLLAWACSGWLLLVAASAWNPRLHVAPASVRALTRIALGGAVSASLVVASPAFAASPTPPPLSLDWPTNTATPTSTRGTTTAPPATHLTPRTAEPPSAPASPVRQAPTATSSPAPATVTDRTVVVRPGDSLWRIAAEQLGRAATPAQVAVAWPQWWGANRAVIGADPDLIFPGTVLHTPPRGEP